MKPYEYPVCWPMEWPRTGSYQRINSRFKTELKTALSNVRKALSGFGKDSGISIREIVISSNATLGTENPKDSGVAIWFLWDGEWRCFPMDRYKTTKENLQAISKIIEAERVKVRIGGAVWVKAAFRPHTGLLMLPPPQGAWRDVLGVSGPVTLYKVERLYRDLVNKHHPDHGGDSAAFARITEAMAEARKELSGGSTS